MLEGQGLGCLQRKALIKGEAKRWSVRKRMRRFSGLDSESSVLPWPEWRGTQRPALPQNRSRNQQQNQFPPVFPRQRANRAAEFSVDEKYAVKAAETSGSPALAAFPVLFLSKTRGFCASPAAPWLPAAPAPCSILAPAASPRTAPPVGPVSPRRDEGQRRGCAPHRAGTPKPGRSGWMQHPRERFDGCSQSPRAVR